MYNQIDIDGFSMTYLVPPEEITYIGDKTIYVPEEFRPPKKGEMIWDIKLSYESDKGNDVLGRVLSDSVEPQWIYKSKEETCS